MWNKLFLLFLVSPLCSIFLLIPSISYPAEWILISSTRDERFYLDFESAEKIKNNIAILNKSVAAGSSERKAHIQKLKLLGFEKNYNDWEYDIDKLEFNCSDRKMRVLQNTSYDSNGNIIDSFESAELDWKDIIPGSHSEKQFNAVCGETLPLKKKRNWIKYLSTGNALYCYDSANIEKSDKTLQVWRKAVFTEKGRDSFNKPGEAISRENPDLQTPVYTLELFRIDCSKKRNLTSLKRISFSADGLGVPAPDYKNEKMNYREGEKELVNFVCKIMKSPPKEKRR